MPYGKHLTYQLCVLRDGDEGVFSFYDLLYDDPSDAYDDGENRAHEPPNKFLTLNKKPNRLTKNGQITPRHKLGKLSQGSFCSGERVLNLEPLSRKRALHFEVASGVFS